MSPITATPHEIALEVLACVGGRNNVISNTLCMTRLRLRLVDPQRVDTDSLDNAPGVLGLATRGADGIEVVFGPRLVRDVYESFVTLTGLDPADADKVCGTTPLARNFHVQITPSRFRSFQAQSAALGNPAPHVPNPAGEPDASVDDLAGLGVLFRQDQGAASGTAEAFAEDEDGDKEADSAPGRRLLVINGPNLNMLGIREPSLYGTSGYDALLTLCKETAETAGFDECSCFQSNHEGDIVDRIQDAYEVFDGIVINPGAYTHTSVAILDALKAVQIPAIEVHISKVDEREEFRQISYVRLACFETITGMGIDGYRKAIEDMATYLDGKASEA